MAVSMLCLGSYWCAARGPPRCVRPPGCFVEHGGQHCPWPRPCCAWVLSGALFVVLHVAHGLRRASLSVEGSTDHGRVHVLLGFLTGELVVLPGCFVEHGGQHSS